MSIPVPRTIIKTFLTISLITLAGALCWYGVSTNRLAVKDVAFLKKNFQLLQPFPDAWLLRGNLAYYVDLEPQAAAGCFRQAIARQPLLIDAWLNLAKVDLAEGREDEARRILQVISPCISQVSTWKWQELLLARDLQDEAIFSAALNFILARLPRRITEACFLAKGFWGDSMAVIPHLAPENQAVFLNELMKTKEIDTGLALWTAMEGSPSPPDKALRLRFCQFLLAGGKVRDAKRVWASWRDDGKQTIYDGGFELEPINQGFGWGLAPNQDVMIERSVENPAEGRYCMHLRFLGTKNVYFYHVSQIIPVEPGKVYRLTFARKSQGLTTDRGVFLEVSGYRCEGLRVRSDPVLGTTSWTREELNVPVPDGCEAIQLRVFREESLMFDNRISGHYWLDGIELVEQHAP